MQLQYVTSLCKHELRRKGRIEQPSTPIAAELIGPHCCESLGSVGKGNSPVLSLCRPLLTAGFNPDQALDVYRAGTPALRVQHGRPLDVLRGALLRDVRGRATTPLGVALDLVAEREGSPANAETA
jgi:hypothetical protein